MTLTTYIYGLLYDFFIKYTSIYYKKPFLFTIGGIYFSSVSNPRTINRKC